MVNESDNSIDTVFAALADPTRRAIIARLLEGEATMGELAKPHDMSLPGMMKHVGRLVDAGLVTRRKEGRSVICALRPEPIEAANHWLQSTLDQWNARFDALNVYLARQKENGT